MKHYYFILLSAFSALLLSGCEGVEVRENLGLNRSAPDEFKVVSRPPLSVPPDFFLAKPNAAAPDRLGPSPEDAAASLVFGRDVSHANPDQFKPANTERVPSAIDPVSAGSLPSSADAIFMKKAGVDQAETDIRTQLYKEEVEQPELESEGDYPLQEWLGMGGSASEVDAKAEAERIRANKDSGKPVNEGEVKTMDDKPRSVLESLF